MKIAISEIRQPTRGAVVYLATTGGTLNAGAKAMDKATGGAISRAMKAGGFKGDKGQWLEILGPAKVGVERILLAGLGEAAKIKSVHLENVGGSAVQRLASSGVKALAIICDCPSKAKISAADAAAHIAFGARLGGYRFDKYRTTVKPKDRPTLNQVTVLVEGAAAAKQRLAPLTALADGIFLTRDLVSEPGNILHPESFAKACRKLSKLGIKVEVLNEARMEKLGMHALLGVGLGSARKSQLVVMHWQGGQRNEKPVAIVGKGVTFDTGGISLKPGPGMESMKWDMGGAGTVVGLMTALASRKAKANVVGVVGLVENMPDGAAQRPGDIVTSMSGQTIEIHNTDAEGRLVLADALWYTQDRFKPQIMIDLATLTGAVLVALGHEYAGLFSNDEALVKKIMSAGEAENEGIWRMPLNDEFDEMINCDAADMKNVGGRNAGSATAAQFLLRFVNDTPWAHFDIAGMAWSDKNKPTVPKGGVGYGVRLLNRLVADHYED